MPSLEIISDSNNVKICALGLILSLNLSSFLFSKRNAYFSISAGRECLLVIRLSKNDCLSIKEGVISCSISYFSQIWISLIFCRTIQCHLKVNKCDQIHSCYQDIGQNRFTLLDLCFSLARNIKFLSIPVFLLCFS